jgi:multiple sugar transport system substrate-binding protein
MKYKMSRRNFLKTSALAAGGLALAGLPRMARAQDSSINFEGELELWDWQFDDRAAFIGEKIEQWQAANPGATISYSTQGWSDTQTKLLTASEAGTNPPMSNVHNTWRPTLQKAGVLVPYPDDIWDYSNLASTPFLRTDEGDVYTCVFNYYCDVVYLNLDILEAEGIAVADVPTTWEDFIPFAQQLTLGSGGFIDRPGIALNHYFSQQWLWQSMVYQQGGFLYNEDGNRAIWNSEAGVRALQIIKDWFNDFGIDSPESERHSDLFERGDAGGFISQGYFAPDLPEFLGDRWTTVPIPTFTGEPGPAWGMLSPEEGFAVFANATEAEQEAAFDFIRTVVGGDQNRIRWSGIMTGPTDRLDLAGDPDIAAADIGNTIASQSATLPYRVNIGEEPLEASSFWRTMFEKVILLGEDAKTALDEATEGMNRVLEQTDQVYLITERNYTAPSEA